MKKLIAIFTLIASAIYAQQTITFTNTLIVTNFFTQAVGRVTSAPTTTNSPWVVSFVFTTPSTPGWAYSTNNFQMGYGASAYSSVTISNSEIATNLTMTLSNVLNASYFAAQSNAINGAAQKLIQNTIGR